MTSPSTRPVWARRRLPSRHALLASRWEQLAAFLVLGGLANGLAQPGSNLALAHGMGDLRQGLAFGVKQSAIPVAGLVAGVSVPVVGLTLGWRAAFAGAALGAAVLALLLPRGRPGPVSPRVGSHRRPDVPLGTLVLLAGACGLGTAAALSLGTFVVDYVVTAGASSRTAGSLLALGAVASIAVRLATGWLADRHPRSALRGAGLALTLGAAGYAGLALGPPRLAVLVPVIGAAFGLGWGWPALFSLTVVRLNPTAPGAATGVTQAGGALGGVVGPLVFGAVVVHGSYGAAWGCAAGAALLAAALMLDSDRRLGGRFPQAPRSGVEGAPGPHVAEPA